MTLLLLAGGLSSLGPILIAVLIIGLFLAGLWYLINTFFPEPMKRYAIAVIVIIAIVLLIYLLLPFAGSWG